MSNLVPTYEEFIAMFPVFSPPEITEAMVQSQIDFAARLLSKAVWSDWYSDGILNVAAHQLSMWLRTQESPGAGRDASAGPTTSVSGAGLSISYGGVDFTDGWKSDAWYNLTAYGQQYLYLKSIVVPCAFLTA